MSPVLHHCEATIEQEWPFDGYAFLKDSFTNELLLGTFFTADLLMALQLFKNALNIEKRLERELFN